MRARIDTVEGPRVVTIRGPADAQRWADELFRYNLTLPPDRPLYGSGVRYVREPKGRVEDWQGRDRLYNSKRGDCEDLSAARASELVASGEDPDARPLVIRPRPRLLHVIVMRGDGAPEDPSAMLGMKTRANRISYKLSRQPGGQVEAAIGIPLAGDRIVARGYGATGPEAVVGALDSLDATLLESGALDELIATGYQYGLEIGAAAHKCGGSCSGCGSCACGGCAVREVGIDASTGTAIVDQLGELAANVRAGNTAGVISQLKAGVEVAKAGASGGGGGINWESAAKAAVTAGCAIGLAASGVAAWAAPACALIGPLWDAVKKWITVKISPDKDFAKEAEAKIPDLYAKGAYKRYRFVKVTKDKAQYDRDLSVRAADGWRPAYEWQKSYGKSYQWGSGKGTYYGAVFDRTSAPPELQDKWLVGGIRSLRALMLPKAQMIAEWGEAMRAQGGGGLPSLPLDFATAADLETYRAAGAARGLEIPATAAPDSEIATNEGYGPLRPIFGLPAPAMAQPQAPASGLAPAAGVTISPVASGPALSRSNPFAGGSQARVPGRGGTPGSAPPRDVFSTWADGGTDVSATLREPPALAPDVARRLTALRGLADLASTGDLERIRREAKRGGAVGTFIREVLRA